MEISFASLDDAGQERGPMLASLSNALVGLYKQYYGKGPTKARSYYLDDMVLCVLRDGLTRAEQTLAQNGRSEAVVRQRQEFQEAVQQEFIDTVEAIVGRRVVAFMSSVHMNPDLNVEIFMLERQDSDEP